MIILMEKNSILSEIESQKILKNIVLDFMKKFVDSTDNISTSYSNIILDTIQNCKITLNLLNTNQELLNDLLQSLNNIKSESNTTYFEKNRIISENTIKIETFLHSMLQLSEFKFGNTIKDSIDTSDSTNLNDIDKNLPNCIAEKEVTINDNKMQSDNDTNIVENTLIISEKKEKVFLPYTLSVLNDILKNNSDKYSSIEDLINKEYTLSFNLFKNPAIARFREAFNLLKKKEKKSIKDSLDLGFELLFNSNLHPAIIAACKNLDELDFYLECLENNETDKFDCFKVIFDITPIL